MTKPYKEGGGWAFRLRIGGQDLYRRGFPSRAAAQNAEIQLRAELNTKDRPIGEGPFRTSLARAFSEYARSCLPFLKGAPSDAGRINRYLRAAGLPVITLEPIDRQDGTTKIYWKVHLAPEAAQIIPNSLRDHRDAQAKNSATCDAVRRRLARMMMADVTTHEIQQLVNALRSAGYKSATISLERAELRRLFNFARRNWKWTRPVDNPACHLDMPVADKPRDVILTNAQWEQMSQALCQAGNEYAPALFCLMLETAMRSCEPLTFACWGHVDWPRKVLKLKDAKAGARDVPLGPGAIAILKILEERAKEKGNKPGRIPWSLGDKIFPTTYEAVKKAWIVARKACGLGDVRMHDLRHTAATRYALQFKGNLPVIMKITGHETVEMALRYINLNTQEVVDMLHGEETDVATQAAGYKVNTVDVLLKAQMECKQSTSHDDSTPTSPPNIVHLNISRRAA